ncbi:MAG: leader peptidase (prepilin peptidase) / N-methyltransferase [Parcubacteria group bacterium Gr01-1014_38]|nr:MAG: leader peptidase (prepilin peptidase) / N-methyltransferase [Parcubacteria group bacterium Gr01-1014_38]
MWRIGALLAGAIVGSFLTTVIERLPLEEQFLRGRSRCARCGMRLTPRDLVPLFSFLTSRGHCRHCGAPIPWWHLAVEVATPVLFILAVALSPNPSLVDQLSRWMLLALLLALTVIDLRTLQLPDSLVAATAVVGALRSLALQHPPFPDAVLGGSVGLFLIGLLALLPWRRAINGADRAPTTAMGLGDAKLAGAMGLTLGLQGLLAALLVAFVAGGLVAGLLLLSKRATLKSRIPFGPFLAGATALLLVVRELPEIFFRLAGF